MNDPAEREQPPPVTPRPATPEEAARVYARAAPNRLVVIEQVYFQSGTQGPVVSECRFERKLSSDDSPYPPPRVTLKEGEYLLLADPDRAGWMAETPVGLVHVRNDGPGTILVCHNDEECTALFLIRPGESFRAEPLYMVRMVLKARGGPCTVRYTLFPA